MHALSPIPLIDRSTLNPFIDCLAEMGAPVRERLATAKLPDARETPPRGYAAARIMLDFIGTSAAAEGIPGLGWRCARRTPVDRIGRWGPKVIRSHTLRDAIPRCVLSTRKKSPSCGWD